MDVIRENFYVYEWYNIDTKEVFYVGKGSGNRYKNIRQRNNYFLNYYNKHNCDVRKIYENMTEEDAFSVEIMLIDAYKKLNQCKCNIMLGGEGCVISEDTPEYYFRKIQYIYDCTSLIDLIPNREYYSHKNLKKMSFDEIKECYESILIYIDAKKTEKYFNLGYFNNLDFSDIIMKDEELTNFIIEKIQKNRTEAIGETDRINDLMLDLEFVEIFVCHVRDILYGIKTYVCLDKEKHIVLKSFNLIPCDDDKDDYVFKLELHAPKKKFIKITAKQIIKNISTFDYTIMNYLKLKIKDSSEE